MMIGVILYLFKNYKVQGNPLRGFPTKNIPLECFSTLLRLEKYKVFRRLRTATKGSAFENCKLLKKLEQNF
ncbi:MAG: hypothetical protein ACLU4Y_00845 [Pseudoruminococcus massiliensis]